MPLIYLGAVFLAIIVLLAFRRPLYQAILGGLLVTAVLYRIPAAAIIVQTSHVFTDWDLFSVLLSLYLITFLQRMLEARGQIKLAQRDLDGLFHNRRVNAAGAALLIGLLSAVSALLLCGDIVKSATDGYLKPREQAFVTSWFRHIPEGSLPTYAGVLLISTLSAVPLGSFMLGMIVPVLVLFALGYFPVLARLPKDTGTPPSQNRLRDLQGLFLHLWTLLLIIVLILVLGLSVVPAVAVSIAAGIVVYRFRAREIASMLRSAVEVKLLLNTFLLLVLKELIGCTGILEQLPDMLSALPIPAYLIFAVLFLLGGVISGASGIIALGTPIAFAAMDGGMPLMVFLMCMAHAASQISPTHVCLVVAADYFHITLGELIRRTIPVSLAFCVLMIMYYNALLILGL
ncbi:MAG: DUF401 family protein [Oscillospiraceae bacterium]|nr:DUF401 family protein [Oscillospiraceae bacterium]